MEEFYKKKIIRDFLTLFSESKWKNLCILCMEYGILMLKQKYQVSSLSMDDIEEFVNDLIEEESKKNHKNLKKLRQDIVSNTNFYYNSNSSSIPNNTSTSFKPSSDWRKGEIKTIFDGDDTNMNPNFNNNYNNNYNQNYNNYHYNNNLNNNKNINIDYGFNDSTTFSNDEPAFVKKGKDKLIDDILYPKQNKIVNYQKDNVFDNNLPKRQQLKQYKTSYNESYGVKKKNSFNNANSRYKNNITNNNNKYVDYNNTTSFTENISFNNSNNLKRSCSSGNKTRFKSGLQKLKINKPLQGQSNTDSMNSSFSVRNNFF